MHLFRHLFLLIVTLHGGFYLHGQNSTFIEHEVSLKINNYTLYGTLTLPKQLSPKQPLALLIAGSGPTDRNGNNTGGLKSNASLLLSHALAEKGIASLRYDKLGSGQSHLPDSFSLEKHQFEAEVADAKAWLDWIRKDQRFGKISILGHSLGGLIGTLVCQQAPRSVNKLVTLCGIGLRGSETLKEQLSKQPQFVIDASRPIIDSLVQGMRVRNVPFFLDALFRAPMQSYLISWFKYDPATELARLKLPILVVQGTNDIQIPVKDAQYLASRQSKAKVVLIEKMNHLFRIVESENMLDNLATYNQPDLPISKELIEQVVAFLFRK